MIELTRTGETLTHYDLSADGRQAIVGSIVYTFGLDVRWVDPKRTELGREGSTLYFTDGTGYPRPDGGRAIQVWEQRPGEAPTKYCLRTGWEESHAFRRIGKPTPKEVREAAARAIFGARVL